MTDNAEFFLEALVAIALVACVAGFALLASWLDDRDVEEIVGPRFASLAHRVRDDHAVPCRVCGVWTWSWDARCDEHRDTAA